MTEAFSKPAYVSDKNLEVDPLTSIPFDNDEKSLSSAIATTTTIKYPPSTKTSSHSSEVKFTTALDSSHRHDRNNTDDEIQDKELYALLKKRRNTVRLYNVKLLVPPLNFALVAEDIYRSGHPLEINYPFLENLKLRTIVYIGDPPSNKDKDKDINSVHIFERFQEWAKEKGIRLVHFHHPSAKEPFRENNKEVIRKTLEIILDTRNLPILLNSNKGKHRIGVLVGVMRVLLQGWSLATTFDEYIKFANGKSDADLEFIERFHEIIEYDPEFAPKWLRNDNSY